MPCSPSGASRAGGAIIQAADPAKFHSEMNALEELLVRLLETVF
jgi:hypothetical protein